ncbi:uncharacterized protein SCDLUD_000753 [Saccharomycodes ludwigii]|uniref:uncharacterized protein n=1 Tax=Saccharomycodes ludwigii TaxID=36035 RepID=UPI001E85966F|nr:hypothetical protein SCDLUD_000753 [Saccharomycodes ludwigii]KAH3903140.1 hypothetical protein SCDLUD_000753 [Saccharomycodes ludwigii]
MVCKQGLYDSDESLYQKKHKGSLHVNMKKNISICKLFPPIIKEQFIPGCKEYIPLFHDGIREAASVEYNIDI